MAKNHLPCHERLLQLMSYDPDTGVLIYKYCPSQTPTWNTKCAGKPAMAYKNGNGYLRGRIDGKNFYAHRVAWKLMTGEEPQYIDHINGDRSDNRFSNLRSVSQKENARNTSIHKSNKSGVMGVHWYKAYNMWSAYIGHRPRTELGYFHCWAKAVKARKVAEKKNAYHRNHGRA